MNVIYEPVRLELNKKSELIKLINEEYTDFFITITVQYKHLLKDLKTKNKGTILGCDTSCLKNYKGSKVLFVGTGEFHALNIKKTYPNKKVFTLNPHTLKIKELNKDDVKKFRVREELGLNALKNGKIIGVIISIKNGQCMMEDSFKLKKRLEQEGKKVYLFLFNTINPSEFLNFSDLDCLINTACPRIGLDDYKKFPAPVVNHELVLSYLK